MKIKSITVMATAILVASSGAALAHTGHGSAAGFMAGFVHPLMGADHLLAMVAVGAWAGMSGGRTQWMIPAAFVTAMAVGGVLGAQGIAIPAVETGIAISVLVFGALVALNPSLPLAASLMVAAVFAVFHGHAHGSEMPVNLSGLSYGLGFVLASVALQSAGIASIIALRQTLSTTAQRIAGGAIGTVGLALLAS